MMENFMTEIIVYVLGGIFSIGSAYLFVFINQFMESKGIAENIRANESLVKIAVKAVQEAYEDIDGAEKFEIAKDYVIEMANNNGVKIKEEDVDKMIESTVKEFKAEFGDFWKTK